MGEEEKLCEGKPYYEILKTKNLDNCVERPVYHKTFSISPASEASNYPTYQSLMTRTIICGSLEDHIIRKSSSENRIYMSTAGELHSKELIDVSSTCTLSLLSVESVENEISRPSSPKRYSSLVFEYPSGSHKSSKSLKQQQQQQQKQQQQHAPIPDLTSSPLTFYPRTQSERDLKTIAIELFSKIVEESEKMTETSRSEKDVAGLAVHATRVLGDLSYNGLKEVEESIKNLVGEEKYESFVEKAFFDLVAITGTNPCQMLINDKIRSGEVTKDTTYWSWIISTSLRQVRTIRASYVLGLTNLVHRACINEKSSLKEFPSQVYGKFCHKEMEVIQEELIPYLKEELKKSPTTDMNVIRLYVTALGNLGTKETTEELLKVIDGKITTNYNVRALAVFHLIKPAMENPSMIRPIMTSIIGNTAESAEVRMAAITTLTYCKPSSADLQGLALRTWFEPSRQVASYIYSTLETLKNLPSHVPEYTSLKQKCDIIIKIAKPVKEGIQYSRSFMLADHIESLRSTVSYSADLVADKDSFLPKSLYLSTQLRGLNSVVDTMEAYFYLQGTQKITDKLYELYSGMTSPEYSPATKETEREVREKMEKLGIHEKESERPEAHLFVKMAGLEHLYSIDEEFVNSVVKYISNRMIEKVDLQKGMEREYLKIMDVMGADYATPTYSGLPLYVEIRYPAVAYGKANLKVRGTSTTEPKVEVEAKGTINYKRMVKAVIVCSVTEKFFESGVETSVHVGSPVKAGIS